MLLSWCSIYDKVNKVYVQTITLSSLTIEANIQKLSGTPRVFLIEYFFICLFEGHVINRFHVILQATASIDALDLHVTSKTSMKVLVMNKCNGNGTLKGSNCISTVPYKDFLNLRNGPKHSCIVDAERLAGSWIMNECDELNSRLKKNLQGAKGKAHEG